MQKKPPMKEVKERFETKEHLVDELVGLLNPPKDDKDVVKERLRVASNSKLLRLHKTMTEISEKFGDREKLVDDLLTLTGHPKDAPRREKLLTYSPGRLLDMHRRHHTAS
ncbi:MAG: hypothetical protein J7M25_09995 [Deltaproteobacteria bacterium]|nr:hypothetical protein [Deltaproteobacteria bacterium]